MTVSRDEITPHGSLAHVWLATLTVSYEADNPEDAEAIAERMLDRALEHPVAIEGEWSCQEVV